MGLEPGVHGLVGVESEVRKAIGAVVGQRVHRTWDLQTERLGLRCGSDALTAPLPF